MDAATELKNGHDELDQWQVPRKYEGRVLSIYQRLDWMYDHCPAEWIAIRDANMRAKRRSEAMKTQVK